jgi:hypothetical protein
MIKAGRDGAQQIPNPRPVLESLEAPRDGVKDTTNIVTNPDRTTVVDLERMPATHLLQYANGSPWPVMYFRRLYGKNDPKNMFDPSVRNATQQLDRINDLIIKVGSAILPQQDTQKKSFTRSGAGTITTSIAPNETDFFVAALGSGRFGLFTVTSSDRKSDNKVAVYEIEYTMLYDVTPEIWKTIEVCTQRIYHYVAERAWVGIDPLLSPEEFRRFNSSANYIRLIEETYVQRFFEPKIRSLAYPGLLPNEFYYDVYLVKFVRALGLRSTAEDLRVYPHTPLNIDGVQTLWKILEQRNPWLLGMVERKGGWYSAKSFRTRHGMNTVAFCHVTATFTFADTYDATQFTTGMNSEFPWPVAVSFEAVPVAYRDIENETLPAYLPLSQNEFYVLSSAFYAGSYASALEYGLYLFLNELPVPSNLACQLAELLVKLPKAEQLYYTPLVYLLLKYTR